MNNNEKNSGSPLENNKRIALRGILIALAMILSYIESFIPVSTTIPGVKLGLANIVTIYALERLGKKDAVIISLLRILLSTILFGNPAVMAYSLTGAMVSILVMSLVSSLPGSGTLGVSVTGAVSHNLGQCAVAALLLRNSNIMRYLPVLLISGIAAGIITGILSGIVLKNTK